MVYTSFIPENLPLTEWFTQGNAGIGPSTELRKWFGHDPKKWRGFCSRYRTELEQHADQLRLIKRKAKEGTVTLIYGARDQEHNEAVVLQELLRRR